MSQKIDRSAARLLELGHDIRQDKARDFWENELFPELEKAATKGETEYSIHIGIFGPANPAFDKLKLLLTGLGYQVSQKGEQLRISWNDQSLEKQLENNKTQKFYAVTYSELVINDESCVFFSSKVDALQFAAQDIDRLINELYLNLPKGI